MTLESATELLFEVDGLQLAALAWGDPANPPLLALHGWLDNAASFARLAPELSQQHYLVALDLTGHGRSSWRSVDATYQIYDDLPQIAGVLDQLGWERCGLLGHSRGAIIAALFTACFAARISHLVLLDGIAPQTVSEDAFVTQLRSFVVERERYLQGAQAIYPSVERAISVREAYGLARESGELIVPRNLRSCEGGYTWSTDPRLRGASAMKLTAGQVQAMLGAIEVPTLAVVASGGLAGDASRHALALDRSIKGCQVETVTGSHHFHMEEGAATLARNIQEFIRKH